MVAVTVASLVGTPVREVTILVDVIVDVVVARLVELAYARLESHEPTELTHCHLDDGGSQSSRYRSRVSRTNSFHLYCWRSSGWCESLGSCCVLVPRFADFGFHASQRVPPRFLLPEAPEIHSQKASCPRMALAVTLPSGVVIFGPADSVVGLRARRGPWQKPPRPGRGPLNPARSTSFCRAHRGEVRGGDGGAIAEEEKPSGRREEERVEGRAIATRRGK